MPTKILSETENATWAGFYGESITYVLWNKFLQHGSLDEHQNHVGNFWCEPCLQPAAGNLLHNSLDISLGCIRELGETARNSPILYTCLPLSFILTGTTAVHNHPTRHIKPYLQQFNRG